MKMSEFNLKSRKQYIELFKQYDQLVKEQDIEFLAEVYGETTEMMTFLIEDILAADGNYPATVLHLHVSNIPMVMTVNDNFLTIKGAPYNNTKEDYWVN